MIVLVTGAPATGKSSVARPLARALGYAYLAKDTVKEALGDALGAAPGDDPRSWSHFVGEATYEVIWALLPHLPDVVVDSNFAPDERTRGRLRELHPRPLLEVFCSCDPAVARRRYEERAARRHPVHTPEFPPEAFSEYDAPVAMGPVLEVDTTGGVDLDAVVAWVREAAG